MDCATCKDSGWIFIAQIATLGRKLGKMSLEQCPDCKGKRLGAGNGQERIGA